MRNGPHRRMRGRGNSNNNMNRKGPNPLTRSYESNGPDVKIRGTAQHIVEKYSSLARDSQVSGDPVMAENYLQHAEHYYRIISAAQAQFGNGTPYQRQDDENDDGDEGEEEYEENGAAPLNQPQPYVAADPFPQRKFPQHQNNGQQQPNGQTPQPVQQGNPQGQQNPRFQPRDRNERFNREDRPQNPVRQEQPAIADDQAQVTRRPRYGMAPRNPMEGVEDADHAEVPIVAPVPRRREIVQEIEPIIDAAPELPAFLTATRRTAPRRPRPPNPHDVAGEVSEVAAETEE